MSVNNKNPELAAPPKEPAMPEIGSGVSIPVILVIGCAFLIAMFMGWKILTREKAPEPLSNLIKPTDETFRPQRVSALPELPADNVLDNTPEHSDAELLKLKLEHDRKVMAWEEALKEKMRAAEVERWKSPMVTYSQAAPTASEQNSGQGSSLDPFSNSRTSTNSRTERSGFVDSNRQSQVRTIQAQRLGNKSYLITQGTLLEGTLESAINSNLAGVIRATVSNHVYSDDGANILIPRGSKIVGQYQSNTTRGQNRLEIIWQRIIRPDNISILVEAPGTDYLGRAGLAGDVDTRWTERFGSAVMLSLLDGVIQYGVNAASDDDVQTVIDNSGNGLDRATEIALENSINLKPTIHIDQGTPIAIMFDKDLDFSSALLN